jgi:hypothetical protein
MCSLNADLRGFTRILDDSSLALHLSQSLGDEGCDLVGLFAAVSIGLVEIEVRQR